MRGITLESYEDKLNKQVLHMDQGLAYNPEFLAGRAMRDYPSRKLQIARAIYKGELSPTEYAADILFGSILSGQGERWQNFGESQHDYSICMMLARELLNKKGVCDKYVGAFKAGVGELMAAAEADSEAFKTWLPVNEGSGVKLLLDTKTASAASSAARPLGEFLSRIGRYFAGGVEPMFAGYEYFAYGLIDEGLELLTMQAAEFEAQGIHTLYALTAQSEYLWKELLPRFGLKHSFKVLSVTDDLPVMALSKRSYIYAGSFALRMLRKEARFNELFPNTSEQPASNSSEFIPLLSADARVNELTMWQKPLAPEFTAFGMDEALLRAIYDDAAREIGKGTHKQLVVFDPYALGALKENGYSKPYVYFAEVL